MYMVSGSILVSLHPNSNLSQAYWYIHACEDTRSTLCMQVCFANNAGFDLAFAVHDCNAGMVSPYTSSRPSSCPYAFLTHPEYLPRPFPDPSPTLKSHAYSRIYLYCRRLWRAVRSAVSHRPEAVSGRRHRLPPGLLTTTPQSESAREFCR